MSLVSPTEAPHSQEAQLTTPAAAETRAIPHGEDVLGFTVSGHDQCHGQHLDRTRTPAPARHPRAASALGQQDDPGRGHDRVCSAGRTAWHGGALHHLAQTHVFTMGKPSRHTRTAIPQTAARTVRTHRRRTRIPRRHHRRRRQPRRSTHRDQGTLGALAGRGRVADRRAGSGHPPTAATGPPRRGSQRARPDQRPHPPGTPADDPHRAQPRPPSIGQHRRRCSGVGRVASTDTAAIMRASAAFRPRPQRGPRSR